MNDTHRAYVLLDRPVTPDTLALATVLRARHPGLAAEVLDGRGDPASSPLIRCGHERVAISHAGAVS